VNDQIDSPVLLANCLKQGLNLIGVAHISGDVLSVDPCTTHHLECVLDLTRTFKARSKCVHFCGRGARAELPASHLPGFCAISCRRLGACAAPNENQPTPRDFAQLPQDVSRDAASTTECDDD
jgi:hypothetical protein